jgi:hypothetical protein
MNCQSIHIHFSFFDLFAIRSVYTHESALVNTVMSMTLENSRIAAVTRKPSNWLLDFPIPVLNYMKIASCALISY